MTTTPTPPLALPALPEPYFGEPKHEHDSHLGPCFTADQMNAHATAAILSDRAGRGDAAGWQPIESVPKDGTEVYLHAAGHVCEGSWIDIPFEEHRDMYGRYIDQTDGVAYWMDHKTGDEVYPTEWMPKNLPAAPTGEAS